MELGFDHDAWPLGQGSAGESGVVRGRLDWHGLRARFLAVRAYRQATRPRGTAAGAVADACFDRSAAHALARFEDTPHDILQGVNLTDSADGKGRFGMGEDVVGAPRPGDRG